MREPNPIIPFRASALGAKYEGFRTLPVSVLLDSVRSLYNVGAFFRTLEAAGGAHLYLAGISATPPHAKFAKTALGADDTVPWTRVEAVPELIRDLQAQQVTVAAIETTGSAVDLFDWRPRFPV